MKLIIVHGIWRNATLVSNEGCRRMGILFPRWSWKSILLTESTGNIARKTPVKTTLQAWSMYTCLVYIYISKSTNDTFSCWMVKIPRLAGAKGLRLHEKVHIVLALWDLSGNTQSDFTILWWFRGIHEIFSAFMVISWDLSGSMVISWDFLGFMVISWDWMGSYVDLHVSNGIWWWFHRDFLWDMINKITILNQ